MNHSADAAIAKFARLRPRLEVDLAACIEPELRAMGATDIVIISESDLSRVCTGLHGFYGYSLRDLYKDELKLKHRKHAETGPAIVICDVTTAKDFTRPAPAFATMISVAVHETAHAILSPIPFGRFDNGFSRREFKRIAEHEPPAIHVHDADEPEPEFPTGGHCEKFARLTIHLAHRMRGMGWPIEDDRLWTPSTCGLSYGRSYRHALRSELESAASLPLTEILRLTPPEEFVELYERNRKRALQRNKDSASLEITGERPPISRPPRPVVNPKADQRTEKMLSLFTRIRQKEVAERESDEQKYKRFVLSAADGTEPGEDELGDLMDVLKSVGKTAAEFESDVSKIAERRRLAEQAGRETATRAEIARVEESAARFISETQQILHQRQVNLGAIRAPLAGLQRQLAAAEEARKQLRRSASPETLQRHAAAQRAAGDADESVRETNRRIVHTEGQIRATERAIIDAQAVVNRPENAQQIREQLARLREHLSDLLEQRAAAESQLADARQEEAAAEAALFSVI